MSLHHAASGEVISIAAGQYADTAKTTTLLKTKGLEVLRLVLPNGKEIPPHKAPGAITVQCLDGRVVFSCHGKSAELLPGDLLYLDASEPHALAARTDSILLVTLVLPPSKSE
jgi:quercetin dioxygenase-like cupin family protein